MLLSLGVVVLAVYLTFEMPTTAYLSTTPKSSGDQESLQANDPNSPRMGFDIAVEVRNNNWFGFHAESIALKILYPSPSSSNPAGYNVGFVKERPNTLQFEPYSRKVITLDATLEPAFTESMSLAHEWHNAAKEQYPINLRFDGHAMVYSYSVPISFESELHLPYAGSWAKFAMHASPAISAQQQERFIDQL